MGHSTGEAEADLLVLDAVQRASDRVRRRLETRGAIDPVGQGFPAYCRVVLHNEVRRQLARRARRHARQVQPDEGLTVLLDAYDNLVPVHFHEVEALILGVSAWSHKWYRDVVGRFEEGVGAGALEVATATTTERLVVADRDASSAQARVVLQARNAARLRVKNHTVVGLHVRIDLVGYEVAGSSSYLPRPRPVVNTQRGVGLGRSTVSASGASTDGGAPWNHLVSPMGAENPRRVAPRRFTPCQVGADEVARRLADTLSVLEPASAHVSRPWLSQQNAHLVGSRVMAAARPSDSEASGLLICALAEWAEPGLHHPFRPGHPGGHPLEGQIRSAVAELQGEVEGAEVASMNAMSQARSRLSRMAQDALAEAARAAHT